MEYLALPALLVLGLFMLLKPELLWKIEHFFSVKGGEPTDFYLAMMRVGGVFFALIAVGVGIFVLALQF